MQINEKHISLPDLKRCNNH